MIRWMVILVVLLVVVHALPPAVRAGGMGGLILDLEGGIVMGGYNDVRIPGAGGTLFSLVDDLETDPDLFLRIRLTRRAGERHIVSLLVAPLRLDAQGSVSNDILFSGTTFPAGTQLDARYRFDSYRLTYRYEVHRSPHFRAGFGVTAKVRDAAVRVGGGGVQAEKSNTGFVPLINFSVAWMPSRRVSLIVEGDALAAPQGRAEDVMAALSLAVGERISVRMGYRLLEGGADNDEVYNFALLHYALIGASISF